jgi:uncharacterized LabA/DUF88 family protein
LTYRVYYTIIINTMAKPNNYAFIDGANLHITYEYLTWKLDYEKLLNYLRKKMGVSIAYYFIGDAPGNKDLYNNLDSHGYTIKLKEPSPYVTAEEVCPDCGKVILPSAQRYKADVDSFLTLQVMADINDFDKAVLISSDGDYDNLVKKLLNQNKLHSVFAPCKAGCSWLLKSAAHGRIGFVDDYRNELEKI